MLRQEFVFVDELVLDRTLIDEFMSVFVKEKEKKLINELRQSETEVKRFSGDDPERMLEVLDRMQELQSKAESKSVYALESRTKKRNLMGCEILKQPNILMLDEATNHLDLDSVQWLGAFLIEQTMPMIIVSHDREFLDRVCYKIVDAEGGMCTSFDGNYSRFLELKKGHD